MSDTSAPSDPAMNGSSSGTEVDTSRVLFRDAEDFERKRERIAAGGSDRLQIISGTCTLRYKHIIDRSLGYFSAIWLFP